MKTSSAYTPGIFPPNSPVWRLVNGPTRHPKQAPTRSSKLDDPVHQPGCTFFDDMVQQATRALVAHVHRELHKQPLRIVHEVGQRTRLRVLGALDYVVDPVLCRVWVEPNPLTALERRSKAAPPWGELSRKPLYKVDLLNPLCKPAWLHYIAARPSWFIHPFAKHQPRQKQLFVQPREGVEVMFEVAQAAFAQLQNSALLGELRRDIATALTTCLGTGLLALGLRSRQFPHNNCLGADHLNLVWQNRRAFETMAQENPRLLSALAAWLDDGGFLLLDKPHDALPAMRNDLLSSGLPPKAWRVLAQQGLHKLLPAGCRAPLWSNMTRTLWALHHANWPPPPPRQFLRLMVDTAGYPQNHDTGGIGIPGWFWNMACNEAHRLRDHAGQYAQLVEQIPQHCFMLRAWQPEPDANQMRRGLAWVQSQTSTFLMLRSARKDPSWYPWLPHPPQHNGSGQLVWVPLRSPRDLLTEAMALHNCADSYEDDCAAGTHLLISLRHSQTGKRLALAGFQLREIGWALTQVACSCNRLASTALHEQALRARDWVNCQFKAERIQN